MIGGGGFKALMSSGGGKGLYAGVWGNLAGVYACVSVSVSVCLCVNMLLACRVHSANHQQLFSHHHQPQSLYLFRYRSNSVYRPEYCPAVTVSTYN
jgi:hypothetical protein